MTDEPLKEFEGSNAMSQSTSDTDINESTLASETDTTNSNRQSRPKQSDFDLSPNEERQTIEEQVNDQARVNYNENMTKQGEVPLKLKKSLPVNGGETQRIRTQKIFSDFKPTAKKVIDDGSIRPATLVQLHKLGFKLVPLSFNHIPVVDWTPIYENPEYWSEEKLIAKWPIFEKVATTFGKTHVKDSDGKDLYLNELDCDSERVYKILATPIEKSKHSQCADLRLWLSASVLVEDKPS